MNNCLEAVLSNTHVEDKGHWSSWAQLYNEYSNSARLICSFIADNKGKKHCNEKIVNLEIAGGIKNELSEIRKVIKQKVLYEFQSLSEEEIKCLHLTDRQLKIAHLRQNYNYAEIAEMLGIERGTVFNIYKQVVNKVISYKKDKELSCLSEKQRKVYSLYYQGLARKEIAEKLELSENTVKTHLRRIKEKLGVTNLSTIN